MFETWRHFSRIISLKTGKLENYSQDHQFKTIWQGIPLPSKKFTIFRACNDYIIFWLDSNCLDYDHLFIFKSYEAISRVSKVQVNKIRVQTKSIIKRLESSQIGPKREFERIYLTPNFKHG